MKPPRLSESVFNAVKDTADSAEISWDGTGGLSVDVYDADGDEIESQQCSLMAAKH